MKHFAVESRPFSSSARWTTDDVRKTVETNRVVVFAKGTVQHPRCGFSKSVLSELESSGRPYEVVDVARDRSVLPALKAFGGAQYVPVVYINGQLVSSMETQEKMLKSGALKEQIEKAFTQ